MVKTWLLVSALALSLCAKGSNWDTVTATNIQDASGTKLTSGLLCFQATDAASNPISFQAGGEGQIITKPFCTAITNGAIGAFHVPDSNLTKPAGVYYTISVQPGNLLNYERVRVTTSPWSLDSYGRARANAVRPLGGRANGNQIATGTVDASDPSQYQTAVYMNSTQTTGVGPGTSGYPFVSGGASAYPSFTTLTGTAFGSQSANTFFAAPNGSSGTATFRAIAAADVPPVTNIAGGALGSFPYQSAASSTAFLSGNSAATDMVVVSHGTGSAAQAPTLSNSPALAVKDAGGQVFNVLVYGADPTGKTDSTTAIQNAIKAAFSVGGIVYIPPGVYLLNESIQSSCNAALCIPASNGNYSYPITPFIIEGSGMQTPSTTSSSVGTILTSLTTGSNTSSAIIAATATSGTFESVDVYVKNLTLMTTANPTLGCINFQYAWGASLENVRCNAGG